MKRFCSLVLSGVIVCGAFAQNAKPNDTVFDKPPKLVYAPDPEFSDEARAAHISGTVKLRIHVTEQGVVDKAVVVYGVGYGLDEKAVQVTQQYRFRPAVKDGVAVACTLLVQVNFVLKH